MLTDNLTHWYRLDEAAGSARADQVSGGPDLAERGGLSVRQGAGLIAGTHAAQFDGFDSYGWLGCESLLIPMDGSSFSLSLWLMLQGAARSWDLFTQDDGAGFDSLWLGTRNGDYTAERTRQYEFGCSPRGTLLANSLPHDLTAGTWHHWLASFDASAGIANLYFDGRLASRTDAAVNAGAPSNVGVGGDFAGNRVMMGWLALLGTWDRALGDGDCAVGATAGGEIAALWNGGAGFDPTA